MDPSATASRQRAQTVVITQSRSFFESDGRMPVKVCRSRATPLRHLRDVAQVCSPKVTHELRPVQSPVWRFTMGLGCPCPWASRPLGWTTATDHGRLEPASMCGDLSHGCQAGTRPVGQPDSELAPASEHELTPLALRLDDRTKIAPAAPMMLLYAGECSENDALRWSMTHFR